MDNGDDGQVTLPHNFQECDQDHLVLLIVDMLNRLIAHNDKIPLSPESLTRFHSRSPPGISLLDYLRRIVKYTKLEISCLLITLHYVDQICARIPAFTISSLTVHRFLITALAVASKALCDAFCTNVHYAKVGGIRVAEFNLLEREFLSQIDWRLTCTRELLQTYYVNLVRTHSRSGYRLLDPPEPLPISPDEREPMINSEDSIVSAITASPGEADATMSDIFKANSSISTSSNTSVGESSRAEFGASSGCALPVAPLARGSTSTGLVPTSSLHPSGEVPVPVSNPRPTLEQNMAFASLISSSSDHSQNKSVKDNHDVETTEALTTDAARTTKRLLQPPDDKPLESRPPVRRRLEGVEINGSPPL